MSELFKPHQIANKPFNKSEGRKLQGTLIEKRTHIVHAKPLESHLDIFNVTGRATTIFSKPTFISGLSFPIGFSATRVIRLKVAARGKAEALSIVRLYFTENLEKMALSKCSIESLNAKFTGKKTNTAPLIFSPYESKNLVDPGEISHPTLDDDLALLDSEKTQIDSNQSQPLLFH